MWAITTGPNFKYILIFTITDDAGIFIMSTVVDPEPWMSAVCYRWFPSWTNDVVQPDGSTALSKTCTMWCWTSPATAQLSAHHIGISQIPVVITHRPPLSSMVDLHSARAAVVRVDQPHCAEAATRNTCNKILLITDTDERETSIGFLQKLHWYQCEAHIPYFCSIMLSDIIWQGDFIGFKSTE